MLDLSAAFDTVDHTILLQRLQTSFGLNGTVLSWFCSYLDQRRQHVCHRGKQSATSDVQFGVPQGSVLGPLLFVLYTADIVNIIACQGLLAHQYADDIQVYGRCRPNDATSLCLAVGSVQVKPATSVRDLGVYCL